MDKNALSIIEPTTSHWAELLTWFENQQQLTQWAGPDIYLPLSSEQLQQQLSKRGAQHRALLNSHNALTGFGQFNIRKNHVHLSRLAVAPSGRGQGMGKQLVLMLIDAARQKGYDAPASLFVYEHNEPAVRCYRSLGFRPSAPPPGTQAAPEDCIFMVRDQGTP